MKRTQHILFISAVVPLTIVALAVVLFLFVLPLIVYNARSMSKQREIR